MRRHWQADALPLLVLAQAVGDQDADGAAVQIDPAFLARSRLGRPGHQLVALPDDLLPDDEDASCEVDVPPAEADSLASPQARQSHDLEQRPEVVRAGHVEESASSSGSQG